MNPLNNLISLFRQSRDEKNGFTLIEIVVTLAILSLALPTLLRSFTEAAKGQALAENRTTALYLLKFQMATIEAEGYPDIGEENGEFGEDSRFRWHSDVQDVELDEIEGLRLVTVTVTWQERGRERSISTSTYLADRQIPQDQTQGGQQGQGGGG